MSETTNTCLSLENDRQEIVRRIDTLLTAMPDSRLEAREAIRNEIGFDPNAGQLHLIVNLAGETANRDSVRDISRYTLALLAQVDIQIRDVMNSAELDSENLSRAVQRLPMLLDATSKLEQDLTLLIGNLEGAERSHLEKIGATLLPSTEELTAASVLAPRLLDISNDPNGEIGRNGTSPRSTLNAAALQAVISDDLNAWREAWEALDEDSENDRRQAVLQQLDRDITAYKVITDDLQEQQGAAVAGGSTADASSLEKAKRDLFTIYLQLKTAVKHPDTPPGIDEKQDDGELENLLVQAKEGEKIAEQRQGSKVTEDELYLNALKDVRRPTTKHVMPRAMADRRAERRRVIVLASVAAVLLAALIPLYASYFSRQSVNIELPISEINSELVVMRATALGPLLYAQVSGTVWDNMQVSQRTSKVDELGRDAASRGFETMYLTDENNRDLATWNGKDGVKLVSDE